VHTCGDQLEMMTIPSDRSAAVLRLGLIWAFAVTAYQGIRWPNDWARAHWLISYDFGFVKRGLPGTLLGPLVSDPANNVRTVWAINIAALFILVLFCLALLLVCRRVLMRTGGGFNVSLTVLVFLTSPFVVMSTHVIGYGDNTIFLFAILASLLVRRGRIRFAGLLLAVGVLVHESIILVGYPSVLFMAWLRYAAVARNGSTGTSVASFLRANLVLIVVPPAMLVLVAATQAISLDNVVLSERLVAHLARFACVGGDRHLYVPEALTTPFVDYLQQWQEFKQRILAPSFVFHTFLPLSVMLASAGRMLRGSRRYGLLMVTLSATTILPLALLMVAWDTGRIWAYPLFVGLLGLWAAAEYGSTDRREESESPRPGLLALAIVCMQIFLDTRLLDGITEKLTPEWRVLVFAPAIYLVVRGLTHRSASLPD
jgi:hypothetical protein